MTQNAKLTIENLISHKMKTSEIDSLTKEELISVLSPSSFSSVVHDSNRVILLDSIIEILVRYFNFHEAFNNKYMASNGKSGSEIGNMLYGVGEKRYLYHGGTEGQYDGYFVKTDSFFVVHRGKNIKTSAISIPKYNISHFFADYLNTDDKVKEAVNWMFEEPFWTDYVYDGLKTFATSAI